MKATELMIGDWVFKDMNYFEEDPMYAKLDYRPYQIESGEDIDLACETNCIGDADVYQPIPLTPEILERNGFVIKKKWAQKGNFGDNPLIMWHYYDDIFTGDFKHELEIHQNDTGKVHVRVQCNYVHELQHILRICGLGDLADNFKLEEQL